jgi:hypothetical protein
MSSKKINGLSITEIAYIAGFLDADGCINAQIVQRSDYKLKFQIRVSITFYQKTERKWYMIGLHKKLGLGVIAIRNDGICTYTITGFNNTKKLLDIIYPFLSIKKKQAWYINKIISLSSKKMEPSLFIKLCLIVDKFEKFNDSKKRTIRTNTVIEVLKHQNLITGVELKPVELKPVELTPPQIIPVETLDI